VHYFFPFLFIMDTSNGMNGASCSSCKKCSVCQVGYYLILIGGVNWGLVGLGGLLGSDLNVVHMLLGNWSVVESTVYLLVGLATLCKALKLCKCCKK
jgi:uncharacterized membrane protein YuzA (DUF378 family)